jgi:hypothetical protein
MGDERAVALEPQERSRSRGDDQGAAAGQHVEADRLERTVREPHDSPAPAARVDRDYLPRAPEAMHALGRLRRRDGAIHGCWPPISKIASATSRLTSCRRSPSTSAGQSGPTWRYTRRPGVATSSPRSHACGTSSATTAVCACLTSLSWRAMPARRKSSVRRRDAHLGDVVFESHGVTITSMRQPSGPTRYLRGTSRGPNA